MKCLVPRVLFFFRILLTVLSDTPVASVTLFCNFYISLKYIGEVTLSLLLASLFIKSQTSVTVSPLCVV
jgi:hypothetical protein